jgi:MoxR-like ATPase
MLSLGISNACSLITLNWFVVHDFAISYLLRGKRAFSGGFRDGLSLLSRQNAPHWSPSEFEMEKAVSAVEKPAEDLAALVEKTAETVAASLGKAKTAIGAVIFGQEDVIERVLVTIISGGHGLLVGVPGLAKTKLVETLGTVLGLDARRVQFTPDLMPSDIIGTEILDETASGKRAFRFVKGPVFAQLLMADEINRASPRTQSALLQAMQEYHVTVAGERHDLPKPFHVLATQNPIEQEGTYPLPEAQLDRFLMQIDVNYPDRDAERKMLIGTTGVDEVKARNALQAEDLLAAQRLVRRLPVGDKVVEAILDIVRSARPGEKGIGEKLAWGPGPRASQSLMLATRARALIDGRLAPSVDDVAALAEPILKHRMALTFAARADGDTINGVIAKLVERLG